MADRRGIRAVLAVATLAATVAVLAATPTGGAGAGPAQVVPPVSELDDDVHLNQIQVVGSHNSYHLIPPQAEVDIRRSFIGAGDDLLQYQHVPLGEQFATQKIRQIELDVFVDTAGGRYADPLLRQVAGTGPYDPAMAEPGMKVLHVQDVDYASNCLTLKECLRHVEAWSDANPTHAPIAVMLELKEELVPVAGFPFVVPEPFDVAALAALDAEIRDVMDPEDLITPDDVRGSRATLEEAVLTDGWPTLGESRGKVLFLMDNGGARRTDYLAGNPNLEGRPIFTNSEPGNPDAAFVKRNDPLDVAGIQALVQAGYVVRTRSDGETVEARANDVTKRDAAFVSGAQWVSTDYPVPDYGVGFSTPFFVEIPGGTVARCNPVNAPAVCRSAELDLFQAPPPTTTSTSSTTSTTSTTAPTTSTTSTTTAPAVVGPGYVAPATPAYAVSGRPNYAG